MRLSGKARSDLRNGVLSERIRSSWSLLWVPSSIVRPYSSTRRQKKDPTSLIGNSVWKSTSASRRMQRPSFLRRLFRQPIGRAERPCRTLPALRPAGRRSAPCKHPFHGSYLPCISRRKPLPDCAFIFRIWRVLPFRDSGILPPVQAGSSHGSVRRWCR